MDDILNKTLTDQQMQAIEYMASGEKTMNIAKLVGVSRQTINNWTKDKTFKSALDRYNSNLKNLGDSAISSKSKLLIDNLISIALTGKSEKNRLDATIYGLNRIYGSPTNKIEQTTDTKVENKATDKAGIDELIGELDNNIIELKEAL